MTGNPTGYDEVWVIGDMHFLANARRCIEALKDVDGFNNKTDKLEMLYILNNFEIFISTFHYSWCFTTQIRGGLTHLLSTKWKLPNYLYVVFSNDQIQDSEILGDEIYKVIQDLFTFIDRAITDRKVVLPKKARRYKSTEVVIVKTVAKETEKLLSNNFKNKRRSFNRALQKTAQNMKWRSINIDSILPTVKENFDDSGEDLSKEGMTLFWKFISEDIKSASSSDRQDVGHRAKNNQRYYR